MVNSGTILHRAAVLQSYNIRIPVESQEAGSAFATTPE